MREIALTSGEYYHVFNRGTDKRNIFSDETDHYRFLKSIKEFNQTEPVVSLYIKDQLRKSKRIVAATSVVTEPLQNENDKLVEIIAFNLLPNHFHLILQQLKDRGVSDFMKRVSGGYTRYFNCRHERDGVLFQGKFKAVHVDSNEKLVYLSAYVNENHIVHGINGGGKFSSLKEYKSGNNFLCKTEFVLGQFNRIKDYLNYAENTASDINETREGMEKYLME